MKRVVTDLKTVLVAVLGIVGGSIWAVQSSWQWEPIILLGFSFFEVVAYIILMNYSKETKDTKNGIKDYGIKINYPTEGSAVKSPIDVSGSLQIEPPKDNIFAIEFNPDLKLYWPKNQIVINSKNKTWYAKLNIGGGDYKQRRLIIAEVTDGGIAFINYYKLVSSPGNHKGIKDFNTVIRILDEVNITIIP